MKREDEFGTGGVLIFNRDCTLVSVRELFSDGHS